MGILNPTPGEIIDRQTILTLKIKHCLTDTDVKAFQKEYDELGGYFIEAFDYDGDIFDEDTFKAYQKSLQDINTELWGLEDERRKWIKSTSSDRMRAIANNAEITTNLNDERAKLIKAINTLYNINVVEKIY